MKEEGAPLIDNYEIIETFHEAAEGTIYRAIDKTSGNKVLIKKYYPALEWTDEVLSEFFNLASYLRFIEHEYLLSIVDIGKDNGKPYVVFADGTSPPDARIVSLHSPPDPQWFSLVSRFVCDDKRADTLRSTHAQHDVAARIKL